MRVFKVVLGILSVIAGFVCMTYPFASRLAYAYVVAVYAGIFGIIALVDYISIRKTHKFSQLEASIGGIVVVVSVLAIILMVCNITIPGFTFASEYFGAVFLICAVLVEGIMTVISAFTYRFFPIGMRVLIVLVGILMVASAVIAFRYVPLVIASLGVFTALGMSISGIILILSAFSQPRLPI